MTLGLTQPLTVATGAWGQKFHKLYKLWEPQLAGALRACPGLSWNRFYLRIENREQPSSRKCNVVFI